MFLRVISTHICARMASSSNTTFVSLVSITSIVVLFETVSGIAIVSGKRSDKKRSNASCVTFHPSFREVGAIPSISPCRNHLRTDSILLVILFAFNTSNVSLTE